MSSFLYRGSDNRKLFNHTPRRKKVQAESQPVALQTKVNSVNLPKILGVILIVVVIVVSLLILLS